MSNREVVEFVYGGNKLKPPEECHPEIAHMIQQCLEMEPVNRPTFNNIVQELEILWENLTKERTIGRSNLEIPAFRSSRTMSIGDHEYDRAPFVNSTLLEEGNG